MKGEPVSCSPRSLECLVGLACFMVLTLSHGVFSSWPWPGGDGDDSRARMER